MRLYFLALFYGSPVWFHTKTYLVKKTTYSWYKYLILKTLLTTFMIQCRFREGKVLFIKTSQTWLLFLIFFLRTFSLRLYRQPPYSFEKKRPRKLKLGTLFPVTFCHRTSENWDFFRIFLWLSFKDYVCMCSL